MRRPFLFVMHMQVLLLLSFMLVGCAKTLPIQTVLPIESEPLRTRSIPEKTIATILPTKTASPTFLKSPLSTEKPSSTASSDAPMWGKQFGKVNASQVRAMLFDPFGNLWVGGPAGLVKWNIQSGLSTAYVNPSGLKSNEIVDLAMVSDKDLWVATYGNGLSRFDGTTWKVFTKNDGLPSNQIWHLAAAQDGTLWLDAPSNSMDPAGFIGTFDGKQWISTWPLGFYQIAPAPDGSIWGLQYGPPDSRYEHSPIVGHFENGDWKTLNITNTHLAMTAIVVASDGTVWIEAYTGFFHYDGHSWQKITAPWIDGKVNGYGASMAVAPDGALWVGFSYGSGELGPCGDRIAFTEELGIYRYDGKTWTHFTREEGLADNKICAIAIGPDGNPWVGTFDKGISHFNGEKWISVVIPKCVELLK